MGWRMAKVLVLHSGGLDSTTCLYDAHAQGHQTVSLGIDYGQRSRVELFFADQQCKRKQIERHLIEVKWAKPDRSIPLDRDVGDIRAQASTAFLPGRNLVFLALASAHGAGIGADEVWTGINQIDFSGYPDCTQEFFDAYSTTNRVAIPTGPEVKAPLLKKTKPEIASLAHKLGIRPGDTWSCYRPDLSKGALAPCGRCDACKLHEYAWANARFDG
jgi:7-cyano-7-deazaguanine synthase